MRNRRWRAALAALLWPLLLSPLAAQEVDWSGGWDSRWRDGGATLYLEQEGELVTGTYPVLDGRIRGQVRGRLLVGEWREPSASGDFVFALAPDGRSFTGRFGTGEWWTGSRLAAGRVGGTVTADASSPETSLLSFVAAGNAARDGGIDRLGPALAVLDFGELPAAATDTPMERLQLGRQLFEVLDQLTFRVWDVPNPAPDAGQVEAELRQAGTGERFELRFRYGVRPNGAAGWFIVVPPPDEMQAALERLLEMVGGEPYHEREHHELKTPRDTMRTFLEAFRVWDDGGDSELMLRTLDLRDLSFTARTAEAELLARYLKEVIDRIGYVLWQEIPNNPARRGPYVHFIHPQGRIEIAAVETEAGERIWQFTPQTLAAARPLYMALEDMPRDAGLGGTEGSTFFALRDRIRSFDRDLLHEVFGVEIWQWLALAVLLVVSVPASWLIAWLLLRLLLRWRRQPDEIMSIKVRFVWPLQALIIAGIGFAALKVLGLPEQVDVPLRVVMGVVLATAGGWLAYHLVDRVGRFSRDATGRFAYRDEMLHSLAIALAKVGVAVGALLVLAEVLGVPYQGVIAGLGIGGLAVALAARSTLENFIGGLTLLADKPIQVGDFCRFGDQLGVVESIGLRSVKLRSLDRTLVTVPNGDFVNLYLENYAKRDSILLRTTLQLRYETTPDQLRWVLAGVRRILLQHPRVLAEPSRARFTGFGAHSLDIEIFAYVNSADYNEYLAIQEDIFLRLIDVVERSGTGFAFPSTVNYLARDTGVNAERREEAEKAVADWREHERLPFPEFDDDERWGMFNQLDYPPAGSHASERARQRREEERRRAAT